MADRSRSAGISVAEPDGDDSPEYLGRDAEVGA